MTPEQIAALIKQLLGPNAYQQPPFRRITWPLAPPQNRGEEVERQLESNPGMTVQDAARRVAGPSFGTDFMLPNSNPQKGQQLDPRDTIGRLAQALKLLGQVRVEIKDQP